MGAMTDIVVFRRRGRVTFLAETEKGKEWLKRNMLSSQANGTVFVQASEEGYEETIELMQKDEIVVESS
jgi:hypothetical protein